MQIAEAFIAIRPQVTRGEFQRDIDQQVTQGVQGVGQKAGRTVASGLASETKKGATKAGEEAGEQLGQGIVKQSRAAFLSLGTAIGVFATGRFIQSAFAEATEAARANAQLGAVLKSTGAEAGVTAKHVDDLAKSEQDKIQVDDDVIKRGASMLLTFRSVRNEIGSGNQVFDRGVKAAEDMAATFGGDLQGAIIQVGKALEDPILGLTALRRVGVDFDPTQRQMIKNFVETGNLLAAQKIILDELEKEFGGAAEAIAKADPFQKFGVDVKNFKETVGRDALPAASELLGVGEKMFDIFAQAPAPIRATSEALAGLAVSAFAISLVRGQLASFRNALEAGAGGSQLLTTATAGLKAALTGLGVGLAAGGILAQVLDHLGNKAPDVDRLSHSLVNLAVSGQVQGALADAIGNNGDKLGHFLDISERVPTAGNALSKLSFGLKNLATGDFSDLKTAGNALRGIDQALAETVQNEGAPKAALALENLVAAHRAEGVTLERLIPFLPQYSAALADSKLQQDTTARSAQTLTERWHSLFQTLFTPEQQKLSIEDAFDSAKDALDNLNEARLDAQGVGEKSKAAAEEEASAQRSLEDAVQAQADAQRSLADAYRGVAEAQDRVREAQAKLAEFNDRTSTRIRALQRSQIVNRQVITPADVRQKEIDLLTFDQQTADRRRELAQNVEEAQNGVTEALRRVSDAERGVQDAAANTAEAQGKVAEAAQKRRQVQVDAAEEVRKAERKAEEAVLAVGSALDAYATGVGASDTATAGYIERLGVLARTLDPSGTLARNLDQIIVRQAAVANEAKKAAAATAAALLVASIPVTVSRFPLDTHVAISAEDRKKLHDAGYPGFAKGGLANWPLGQARLAIVHGQEDVRTPAQRKADEQQKGGTITVTQENHFHGTDTPSASELDFLNRDMGWRIARLGRR